MATETVTLQSIASESLYQLQNNLIVGNLLYKDKTADFQGGAYAKGSSVTIKTRPDFETKDFGTDIELQDIRESSTTLDIDKHFDISVPFTSKDSALNLDGISSQIVAPMMTSMSQRIDEYLLSKITDSRGLYASTSLFQNAGDIAQARKVANEQQVNQAGRIAFVDSSLEATMLGVDSFNRYDSRAGGGVTALEQASLGNLMNMSIYSSVNFTPVSHTLGDGTATTKTTPTGTENAIGTSTLFLQGTSVGTFEAGDRINVGGYRPLIVASQVLVGASSIPLAHQIDELIGVTKAVTVVGAGNTSFDNAGIIISPNAYAMACPPLELPADANSAIATANGMSIRLVKSYDIVKKRNILSADLLMGAKCYDPRQSVLLGRATA